MPEPTADDPDVEVPGFTEAEWARQLALLRRPWRWCPIARAVAGVHVVALTPELPIPADLPPHRRLLLLLLLFALKDRASALHFEPDRDEEGEPALRLLYEVDGELLDLVPPPFHLGEPMMREVEALAGYRTYRRRVAANLRRLASQIDGQPMGWESGRFRLQLDADLLDVTLRTYPSDLGNRLFLDLPLVSAEQSAEAQRHLQRVFASREGSETPAGAMAAGSPARLPDHS